MEDNNACHIKKRTTAAITVAFAVVAITALAGCVKGVDSPKLAGTTDVQEQRSMHQKSEDALFSLLQPPVKAQVEMVSIRAKALSMDGQSMIGEAEYQGQSKQGGSQAFRWDIKNNQWLWLKDAHDEHDSAPVGMNSTGSAVFGSQWVWQQGATQSQDLGGRFWAYALRDDGKLLGVELENHIVMRSIDGQQKQSWPAAELFSLDANGHVNDQFWFAGNGVLVSSTVGQCLATQGCQKAYFMRWTPENGKSTVIAQLPPPSAEFIQSNPRPQIISQNGLWLAGGVGQGIYLWGEQGQIKFLGGFESGGTVLGLSNDGQLAVGSTIDSETNAERSWIWTATEGLGWLDEWLRDHGVSAEQISTQMQVKLLSADRRVLIGVTEPLDKAGQSEAPIWWRIDLPERLRVLI